MLLDSLNKRNRETERVGLKRRLWGGKEVEQLCDWQKGEGETLNYKKKNNGEAVYILLKYCLK